MRACAFCSHKLQAGYIWHVLCYCHPTLGQLNYHKVESAPLRPQIRLACSSIASFVVDEVSFVWTWARQWLRHEEEGTAPGMWPWSQGHQHQSSGGKEWECLQLSLDSHIWPAVLSLIMSSPAEQDSPYVFWKNRSTREWEMKRHSGFLLHLFRPAHKDSTSTKESILIKMTW